MAAEELGRIDRPEAGPVIGKRKVYIVVMMSSLPEAPDDYKTRLNKYWDAVDTHIGQLEARAGMVSHIFHEAVSVAGDLGLKLVSQVNQPAYSLIKSRMDAGATLEAFDDDELFSQIVDWSRCMQVGLTSQAVADVIQEKYTEAAEARFDKMSEALEEKIGESEAALLIMSSTRGVTMPDGVEQFNVMPPELDELVRWVRDQNERAMAEAQQAAAAAEGGGQDGGVGSDDDGPKLWTPGSA